MSVPPGAARGPIAGPDAGPTLARLLAALRREGAAGHAGDLYDNRDRGHSRPGAGRWPQLAATAYDADAAARGLDYGLNHRLRFAAPTIGNSSTAIADARVARSLPRWAMTTPGVMDRLQILYESNHLYVYPEHRDHDRDRGDLFPALAPHFLVSQGSSGSDQALVDALAVGLAALRADVKQAARDKGLIAPLLQMLVRRALVDDDAAYLGPAAHPAAVDAARLDLAALARRAHGLRVGDLLPAARLAVVEEPSDPLGPVGDGLSERLFDTPSAAARVAHGLAGTRRYVLDAGRTLPLDDRPLRHVWRTLRGGDGVRLEPLTPDGRRIAATVPWLGRRPDPVDPALGVDRVDIALFVGVEGGSLLSAPAFFCVGFDPQQRRTLDAQGRVLSVDYRPAPDGPRRDPLVTPARRWRDDFRYAADGRLLGWRRSRDGGAVEDFTAHGLRVLTRDARGRPALAEPVAHPVARDDAGRLSVDPAPSGPARRYVYDGPEDALGRPAPPHLP